MLPPPRELCGAATLQASIACISRHLTLSAYFVSLSLSSCLLSSFVELRDFTTGVTLARQDFTVVTTGPAWGSTWIRYNFNLTPSAGVC